MTGEELAAPEHRPISRETWELVDDYRELKRMSPVDVRRYCEVR